MNAHTLSPMSESERQRALDQLRLVGSLPEESYDHIVRVASALCDAPIALISLLDREQQWFKAKIGVDAAHTERNMAVCDHAIRRPQELMEVRDVDLDERFVDNPILKEVGARFYAGMPLVTQEGAAIGTVCVLDHLPRQLNAFQRQGLESLARLTMSLIEARAKERTHEVVAIVEQAIAPQVSPAKADLVEPPPYHVIILEIQGLAEVIQRMGPRTLERELIKLDQDVEACLDLTGGDNVSRVSGAGEFVVVLQGDLVQGRLNALEGVAQAATSRLGTPVLMGTAASAGNESAGEVFLRADRALSAQKDQQAKAA
jgi:hypothetical protein